MNKTHYIGLDVHKEKAAIAHAQEGSREEPVYHGKCAASVQNVERTLRKLAKKLDVEFRDLKVCYEAGPTGFVLARRLIHLGVECVVIAPSKTERKPGERVKTDKRDALNAKVLSHLPRCKASTLGWGLNDHGKLNSRRGRC